MTDEPDIPERWTVVDDAADPSPPQEDDSGPDSDADSSDPAADIGDSGSDVLPAGDAASPDRSSSSPAGSGRSGPSRREIVDRRRSRAWALQVHYQWDAAGGERGNLHETFVEIMGSRRIAKRRLPRIRRLVRTLDEHLEEVDAALEEALDNWRLERVSSIDRGILRLAATEIMHMDDIPPKASIQEALALAEAYGGNESPRFVNGVLDAIYRKHGGDRPAGG